jgi:hypothetical protein
MLQILSPPSPFQLSPFLLMLGNDQSTRKLIMPTLKMRTPSLLSLPKMTTTTTMTILDFLPHVQLLLWITTVLLQMS